MRSALLVLAILAIGCHGCPKCDAKSCPTGCCSATSVCETGADDHVCGTAGAACTDCLGLGQLCVQNSCTPPVWLPPDSGPWYDAGFTSVPPTQLCLGLAQATCDWYQRCGRLDAPQFADCVALAVFGCAQPIYDELADGGSQFDSTKIAACLDDMAASPCVGGSTPPGAADSICQHLATGATPLDAGCPPGIGDVCMNGYCNGTNCPGACTPFTPIGGVCTDHPQCGPSAYCGGGTPRVCTAYKTPADPCSPGDYCIDSICDWGQGRCVVAGTLDINAVCSSSAACSYGLYCVTSNGFPIGVCLPWVPQGGPCNGAGAECGEGLTCKGEDDAGNRGTCQPQSQLGQPCRAQSGDCAAGLLCSPALGCLAWQSLGQACDPATQNCKIALWCDNATSVCELLPRLGQTCADSTGPLTSCFDGQCDYSGTRLCIPRGGDGGFCTTDGDCASGSCDAKTYACQPLCTTY